MSRFIVFTEVDESNKAAGDVVINTDCIVGFDELGVQATNSNGDARPQCRLYLSSPLFNGDTTYTTYIDVLGGLIDTRAVLNG